MIKKATTLLIGITFISFAVNAQESSIWCNALEVIVKDGSIFKLAILRNDTTNISYGSGKPGMVAINGDTRPQLRNYRQNFVLIDTFGFFAPQCSGKYHGLTIEICNKKSCVSNVPRQNIFWVSAIATGKENALAIGIFRQSSNHIVVYYLSVLGKDIQIVKKTSGDF